MAAILWKFKLFDVALIWLQIRNLRPRISGIGLFWTLCIHFWRLFITCQNFEEICKYVRLTVCLLLAKISKKFASMFVCFVTCQNFEEICKYVRLSVCLFVCLSVCLSVCLERDTGRNFWPINTKLGPHMESGPSHRCILFIGRRSNN